MNDMRRVEAETSEPLDQPAPDGLPRRETPIVPVDSIAGRALVAVIAIMTVLASLTGGAGVLVGPAANEWPPGVAREGTTRPRPTPGRAADPDVATAAAIAEGVAGIDEVKPYSKEESAALLEPWLGTGLSLDE